MSESSEKTTIKLKYPVKWGESTVSEVVLDRPTGHAIENLGGKPTMGDLLKVAARCCDFPDKFFRKVDARDCMKIAGAVGDFLDDGQETGETA